MVDEVELSQTHSESVTDRRFENLSACHNYEV